ncbi:hypothetical protein [Nocardioides sp.]|uniref:hypothetical protein n=1 Tax=Nocardioides sp. TaxID=35761 RepID=UPI00356B5B0C
MTVEGELAAPVHLCALGTAFTVTSTGPGATAMAEQVERAWSRCVTPEAWRNAHDLRLVIEPDSDAVVSAGSTISGGDPDLLMAHLTWAVTAEAIGRQAGNAVMLHAAAVADPETGRAVALIGPSGTGKTTAARHLATRFGYVTDETVAVLQDLSIVPFAKPLSVIEDSPDRKRQVPPEELALLAAPADCRLVGVLLLERDGSATATLESVSTVAALSLLAPHTSYLAELEAPLHRFADVLEAAGGLRVVRYAEADDLTPIVAEMLSGP